MTQSGIEQQASYEQQMLWLANKQARTLDAIKVAVWILAGLAIAAVVFAVFAASRL